MSAPKKVLVVDDHPMFRDGLVALVESFDWAEVVGQAEDADGYEVELVADRS